MTPGVANGQSEIKLDRLEFHRPDSVANQYGPDEGWTGLIQAVLFEVNDRDKIGYPTAQGYRYCCVKELVPKTKCHLDRLIYQVCSGVAWNKYYGQAIDPTSRGRNILAFSTTSSVH